MSILNILLVVASLSDTVSIDVSSPWPYQHVDKRSRLSNSAITSVFMDRYDQVWLGTWDGLDRYDGSSIRVYKPDPSSKGSISNNIIRNVLEDGFGNLWVITHQGINRYNSSTDTFQRFMDESANIPFLENNIRACIGSDSTIWVSQIGKGLSRYSPGENAFKEVTIEGVSKQWLASVVELIYFNRLLYLLGSDGKLLCVLDNHVLYTKELGETTNLSFHKFIQIRGNYFLAVFNAHEKLQLYNLAETNREPYSIDLGSVSISSLSESLDKSAIWIGTESGDIFKVEENNNSFVLHEMNSYFPHFSKSKIKILTITETHQDLIWIGTDGDGVYKFLTRPKAFYSIQSGAEEEQQLSHNIIRAVYEDKSGVLYIGTRGGGLNIIDKKTKGTQIITTRNGLSNNAVLAINKDHQGNYWIGLDGEGIDMIEAKSQRMLHFPRDFENSNPLMFGAVYAICIDVFGNVWLGTSGYGIIRLTVSKSANGKYLLKEYDQINSTDTPELLSMKSNIVYSILEEKPNVMWFGTRGGGIYRYNSLAKKIEETYQSGSSKDARLNNNDVLSMHMDAQEQLWIGTSGGLNCLHLKTKPYRIDHFTQQDGLPNNTVHGILHDASGAIWISTNRGLTIYHQKENRFKNFDSNDGLANNEFTDGSTFGSEISERLFFGGLDGLDVVYPSKLNSGNHFPRLMISDFQVRNKEVRPGDEGEILSSSVDFTKTITLKHDQNFINFYFTTLDYWNKQKVKYSYYLENFDRGWNYIEQQQSITLTNIPPGQYTLYINSTNDNGAWNSNPRSISIIVLPPLYKTTGAYLLYILFAIGIQVGVILYIRWRGKVKRNATIEKLKTVQLKELNDHKLQFFTNVAHEFRTPLTLIMGPIASLLKKNKDVADMRSLKGVYSNSLRLQKLIEELIQFRKIETGKDRLFITNVDLIALTQKIIESFQLYANEREVNLEFFPEPEHLMGNVDVPKIEKILINLISNAIKYSTRGCMVSVIIQEREGKVIFIVKDEGIGISETNKEKIFESFYQNNLQETDDRGLAKSTGIGLSLTKSLVISHKGELLLESTSGKGSVFTVIIPIARDAYADQRTEIMAMIPISNLKESISLEFETAHYPSDQPEKVSETILGKYSHSLLVVDDNAQIIALLENILSDRYVIHTAHNGKTALSILEAERIDLVISDIIMPGMDGLTLCKMIKENIQTSHIPVILLTAKADTEDRIEGLQVGADSYIPKPFHPEHLFVRIEKLLEHLEATRGKFKNLAEVELQQLSTGINEKEDRFFLKITTCIQANLTDAEFNADTIAEEVGMSKASLYKKVKTITGLTPHGLIKQYRLKRAAELLKDSTMSVSEVIDEIGFNSRSYFYKSFNEMFHCHPKEYGGKSKVNSE